MTPSRYCLVFGVAAAGIAAAIAAFNYITDPYLVFDAPRTTGFNSLKPAVETRERMMKAYQAERISARTIVLGSSRTDLGIDPAAPGWPATAKPVYNLSLVGTTAGDSLNYLRHHVASRSGAAPQMVVIGLDFESFLYRPDQSDAPTGEVDEVLQRLVVGPDGQPNEARRLRVLTDQALALLSLDASFDSIRTIAGNRSGRVVNLKPDGGMSDTALRATAAADGFALLFDQKNVDTVKNYGRPRRLLSDTPVGPIRRMQAVTELLAFAKAHRINVVLAIQPAHVSRLELLDRMGYWSDYERWKRELTTLVAGASKDQDIALWDFGGYEDPAQEPVPAKGTSAGMKWFWDPVHYSTALGARMVARMFDRESNDQYGVQLTPLNIDEQLARVRRDRNVFRAAQPAETARLVKLACGNEPCPDPVKPLTVSR
ncbi:hypothetical protein [Massilia sp. 9I]|uniref:hypothetical protein n=1 Tax=Massilia sp. 9I TaxID=2653152 RepID=UPI0012F36A5B|nr:hypothetical protein [Massilia sp. 9I]VXC21808.1 conserved hypothetical protein [Massilia sp. 9I]